MDEMDEKEMTEAEFLKAYDPSRYPRPSVAVDAVVFGYFRRRLHVLLVRRKNHPFRGRWVLPGGFIEVYEDPDEAVKRELYEETGVEADQMVQIGTFGRPDRDPRYHVISIAYMGVVLPSQAVPRADDDAAEASWFPATEAPPLGFDHSTILGVALGRLRAEMLRPSFAARFLGRRFTGRDLISLYGEVFGEPINASRFLRRLAPLCLERPTLTGNVRLSRSKLRRFEANLGKWWV